MTAQIIQWRVCPRFPMYEVSDTGDVRRWKVVRGKLGGIVQPWLCQGYRRYHLRADGRYCHPFAHQLVAEAFIGPKPFDGAEVCHNDGDKLNVHPTNLRWDTHKANLQDAVRHGASPRGAKNGKAKTTADDVKQIRELYGAGTYQRDIAGIFGISQSAVSMIITGANWAHLQ